MRCGEGRHYYFRSFGSCGKGHPNLKYDNAAFLLAMVTADKALINIDSLDDLQKQEISPG
jgi:hypothetical protein